jgi:hypothetical protein
LPKLSPPPRRIIIANHLSYMGLLRQIMVPLIHGLNNYKDNKP